VPDEEIKGILDEHADNAAKKLVGAANAAGGGDNITAVVISNS
jgi:serine/threonine protein phosphatase PrpC